MIKLRNWKVFIPSSDQMLGYEGDHLLRRLEIKTDTDASWAVVLDLEQDGEKYTVSLDMDDGILHTELTRDMLRREGVYTAQLRGLCGETVAHSNKFQLYVRDAINAAEELPEHALSYLEALEQRILLLKVEVEQSANAAEDSAQTAEEAQQAATEAADRAEAARESIALDEAKLTQTVQRAEESAETAQAGADAAQEAAGRAEIAVEAVETARTEALSAATQAKASQEQAAESETAAKEAWTAAEEAQTKAQDAAERAVDAAGTVQENAETSKTNAEAATRSAAEAQASEQAATQAAGQASTAQAAAEQASVTAEAARAAAEAAAASTQGATDKAEAAASSAQAVLTAVSGATQAAEAARDAAQTAQSNAQTAETAAREQAAKAVQSADDADLSAIEARSWAVGGTGTRPGEDTDNARYYKEQARQIAGGDYVTAEQLKALRRELIVLSDTEPSHTGPWIWMQPVRRREVGAPDVVLNLSDEEVPDDGVGVEIDGVIYNADNATTDESKVKEGGYLFKIQE